MQSKAFLSGYMQKLSGPELPPQLQDPSYTDLQRRQQYLQRMRELFQKSLKYRQEWSPAREQQMAQRDQIQKRLNDIWRRMRYHKPKTREGAQAALKHRPAVWKRYMRTKGSKLKPAQLQAAQKLWKERGQIARKMAGKTDEVVAQQ